MRIANLIDRIHTIDYRANPPVRDQRQDRGGKAAYRFGFLFDRARAKHCPDNGSALSHEQAEIDFRFRTGRGPDANDSPAYRQRFQAGREVAAADEIDNDINPRAIRPCVYRFHEFRRRIRNGDAFIQSQFQLAHPLKLIGTARRTIHRRTGGMPQLHRRRTDPGSHRMNKNAFAHLQSGPGEERVMRGNKNFRHGTSFFPAQLCRNPCQIAFRHDDVFRLRSAAGDSKNSIANFPCVPCLSHCLHFTGKFKPGNVLRITVRRRIMSAALKNIGPVQSRRVDPDPDSIGRRRGWSRDLAHADSFHSAMRCDDYRAHDSTIQHGAVRQMRK